MSTRSRSQTQAHLCLHFIVVGGGLTGLCTALALTRAGHRVTVLEQEAEDKPSRLGGIRFPPNQSKLLARWGLKEACDKIAFSSRALRFYKYGDGDYLGRHDWDAEVLQEAGGDWTFARYTDMRDVFLSATRAHGATVRFNARVTAFDESKAQVTLENGEVITADVVVGADGVNSAMRSSIFDGAEDVQETDLVMFDIMIPVEKIRANPKIAQVLDDDACSIWFGDRHAAIGYPAGTSGQYSLIVFTPRPTDNTDLSGRRGSGSSSIDTLLSCMGPCDASIRALASMAFPPTCVAVNSYQVLDGDDWILPSFRGVVLGDAAHPAPPGQMQSSAMAFEDAAVLAKLFSHLRRNDQITSLLNAFASLRATRAHEVLQLEAANIQFMTLAYSNPMAQARDEGMKDMTNRGKDVLRGENHVASADGGDDQWETIYSKWTYDAEDEADDWWVEWGALGERAQEAPKALAVDFGDAITGVQIEVKL